jgi:similar to stage IV sporulation protein
VLISGTIGSDPYTQIVVADGTVKGLVWYTSRIEAPLVKTYNVYSGESIERNYLVLGTRAFQLTGYGKQMFLKYETLPERKNIQLRSYTLPVGWLHEKVMEVHQVKQPVAYEEVKLSGLQRARAELLLASGEESRITNEKILHEKTENGKVYMEVLFEVEELIMKEQPIVIQGE